MKRNKFLTYIAVLTIALISYACNKEGLQQKPIQADTLINPAASACSPQAIYPIFTGCQNQTRSINLDFSLGLSLYSTGSTLYQLCPGVQFNVTYTFTTCFLGNDPIHFVHNLNYNLADIIAACPALQAEINNQQALGNLVGFLDQLDFDISKQVEFTEAYNAAVENEDDFLCGPNGGEFYNIKYIQNSCFKWIPFLDGPKDRPIPAFRKENCENGICCIRIGRYCVERFFNGEPVLQGSGNSTFERTEGTCPIECTHECGDPNAS